MADLCRILTPVLALALTCQTALANCAADTMIVFDASASMTAQDFNATRSQRIHQARAALAEVLPEVEDIRRIGLTVYGPEAQDSCGGIRLRLPPRAGASAEILSEIDTTAPAGLTPLTEAVARAAEALSYRTRPAVVVLVTDGNESCGGSPCALADRLAATSADLTVHVLGYKVVWDAFASHGKRDAPYFGAEVVARCLADRTGGTYASTESVAELTQALRTTLGCLVFGGLPRGSDRSSH